MRRLDDRTLVSGQIAPELVETAAALGVTRIINNRPDGEEPGQPLGADIAAAARAAGLDYRNIEVAGGISPDQIDAMAEALDPPEGLALAFCRSGTRSAFLWALARARGGEDPEVLAARAGAAGYDLSPILTHLRR